MQEEQSPGSLRWCPGYSPQTWPGTSTVQPLSALHQGSAPDASNRCPDFNLCFTPPKISKLTACQEARKFSGSHLGRRETIPRLLLNSQAGVTPGILRRHVQTQIRPNDQGLFWSLLMLLTLLHQTSYTYSRPSRLQL